MMAHTTHFICPNAYRLVQNSKAEMQCCQCIEHENCGDEQSDKWIKATLKRIKEEQAIIKNNARIEDQAGEDGYIPD